QLANVLGLPVKPETQPNPAAFKVLVAVGTLATLLWLAARRKLTPDLEAPFTAALALLAGLQVIGWYFPLLLPNLHALSAAAAAISSGFFLVALLWDLLTSGEQVTNRESRAFPREARVLFYLGYTVFAASTFLYLISQRLISTGGSVPVSSNNFPLEVIGAEGWGIPLLAFT